MMRKVAVGRRRRRTRGDWSPRALKFHVQKFGAKAEVEVRPSHQKSELLTAWNPH